MKNYFAFSILLIILTTIACGKDNEPDITDSIQMGYHDDSFNYHEYAIPISPIVVWDLLNLHGVGEETIHLQTSNGTVDIVFTLSLLNPDSIHLIDSITPEPYPYLHLKWVADFDPVVEYETVSVGQGSSTKMFSIRPLNYTATIDNISNYSSRWSESRNMRLWEVPPSGSGNTQGLTNGPWYNLTSIKYIGFNNNGKLGWIKIDNTNRLHPKIISYAVRK